MKAFSPPHLSEWPNAPLLIRRPSATSDLESTREIIEIHKDGPNRLSEIDLESEFFSGKMYLIVKGLKDFPEEYFSGKRRFLNVIVQGRFKRPHISYASLVTGQIFSSNLHSLPPSALLLPFQSILETFQPSLEMDLSGSRPYIISPLMSTMQAIAVSRPGEEPSISDHDESIVDDLHLVSSEFENLASSDRKRFFSHRSYEAINVLCLLVYTFNFYQDVLDLGKFEISVGFMHIDISRFLGRLPVQIMAAIWNKPPENQHHREGLDDGPEYVYNIEVWHQKCFSAEEIE